MEARTDERGLRTCSGFATVGEPPAFCPLVASGDCATSGWALLIPDGRRVRPALTDPAEDPLARAEPLRPAAGAGSAAVRASGADVRISIDARSAASTPNSTTAVT
ncbi:hypothetical protein ACFPRL_07755 [Pseudoclavibacter helvolus]